MRLALGSLLVVFALAGCGQSSQPAGSPGTSGPGESVLPPATSSEQPHATADVTVYLARGEQIGAARVVVTKTPRIGAEALEVLLGGPTALEQEAGLHTEIPPGTKLLGLSVEGGVATVDLSRDFESGGGSLSMRMRIAQVVFTLTQFPTVERVAFEFDGTPVDAIGGEGVVVSPSVHRGDFEDLSPAILVESPAPFDKVRSPLRLRGTANTFEATFEYRLEDAAGNVLAEHFAMATSGSGTRGTFDLTIGFDVSEPGPGKLVVFESSAENGLPIHVVEIPVFLSP